MPIIINGGSRSAGGWWAKHLGNTEKNARVELIEMRGLSAETMPEAFREMQALSRGTRCENFFYQANINPRADEQLTPAQWREAVDTLEKNLGLTGQPRFVVEHEKDGRTHRHIVWSRIDAERMVAISDSLTAVIHERTSRELEIKFDLERGQSILVPDRDFERPERGAKKWETFRAVESGLDPKAIKAEIAALWQRADNGQAFKAGLEASGYILAKGDRRDFVLIDPRGDDHSLARRLGVKAAELRERMKDVDRTALPSVAEAKSRQHVRQAAREARRTHDLAAPRVTVEPSAKRTSGQEKPKARPWPELGKNAGEIRLAWSLSRSAEEFAEALAARGMTLAQATADEARESRGRADLARKWRRQGRQNAGEGQGRYASLHETERPIAKELSRFAPVLKEGEIVAVNGRGDVTRIDQRTTGELRAEIDKRLGTLDPASLPTVTDAREAMREASRAAWIEVKQAEREKAQPATKIEAVIAGALRSTMDGYQFAEAIDKAGITIVRATAADVLAVAALREQEGFDRASGIAHKPRHFAKLEAGDFAAVTRRGDVYRLNPYRLDFVEIEQRLADTQRRMPGVVEARATFEIAREATAALWAQRRADNTAARVARDETRDAGRELRDATRTVERETRKAMATAHQAVDTGTRAGRGILGGMASMVGKVFDVLADMIAPAPPPTVEQAERMERVAEERQEQAAIVSTAAEQEARFQELRRQMARDDAEQKLKEQRDRDYRREHDLTR